jgi:F0F1-type ATP synthase membrane subunit c/vacuolar-type H+-ATPase subunit K
VNLKRIIGLAFLMSVAMYAVVVHFILREPAAPAVDQATLQLLTVIFYMSGAVCLLTALVLVRRLKLSHMFVVAFALAEVPAILGLVHALLSRTPRDFNLLAASSAVFIVYFAFRGD